MQREQKNEQDQNCVMQRTFELHPEGSRELLNGLKWESDLDREY